MDIVLISRTTLVWVGQMSIVLESGILTQTRVIISDEKLHNWQVYILLV